MVAVAPQVVPEKVLTGLAACYFGPWDPVTPLALPLDTVAVNGAWPAGWTPIGATTDGLTFKFSRDVDRIMIEESPYPVDIRTKLVKFLAEIELAQDSVDEMLLAYGGGVKTTVAAGTTTAGVHKLQISKTLSFFSFGFEKENEYGLPTRVILPKVQSVADASTEHRRSNKQRSYKISLESLQDLGPNDIREVFAPATGP